jgi:hypothetical protein
MVPSESAPQVLSNEWSRQLVSIDNLILGANSVSCPWWQKSPSVLKHFFMNGQGLNSHWYLLASHPTRKATSQFCLLFYDFPKLHFRTQPLPYFLCPVHSWLELGEKSKCPELDLPSATVPWLFRSRAGQTAEGEMESLSVSQSVTLSYTWSWSSADSFENSGPISTPGPFTNCCFIFTLTHCIYFLPFLPNIEEIRTI